MRKVYFEWYLAVFFGGVAALNYLFNSSHQPEDIRWYVTLSVICFGVNSVKQFINENKGEVR